MINRKPTLSLLLFIFFHSAAWAQEDDALYKKYDPDKIQLPQGFSPSQQGPRLTYVG